MNEKTSRSPYMLASLLVFWLILAPASVAAQSGPPPQPGDPVCYAPAGTVMVEAAFPAVAPAGVAPLVGPGALAVIPAAANGSAASITTDLGGCLGTFIVPANASRSLVVRIQGGLSAGQLPVPALLNAASAACRFSVAITDAVTGQPAAADLPPAFAAALMPEAQAGALLGAGFTQIVYFDMVKKTWQAVPGSSGAADAVHSGMVGRVQICCLASTPQDPNRPKGLPNTGGNMPGSLTLALVVALVTAALITGGFGWLRRGHRPNR